MRALKLETERIKHNQAKTLQPSQTWELPVTSGGMLVRYLSFTVYCCDNDEPNLRELWEIAEAALGWVVSLNSGAVFSDDHSTGRDSHRHTI